MNGKDLWIGLGDISHKYYEEAERDALSDKKYHKLLKRPLLVAAMVALALLLVGCAVVYALRLQDMSIGQETYTQNFAEDGRAIEPTEKTRDIITLYGHSGDPIQLALKEWYEFLEVYDPDGERMDNNPDHAEIPNRYEYTYGCYTRDMVEKVDEIARKYDLKLLEEWIPFQRWQSHILMEASGIGSLVRPDSGAEISDLAGMFHPPYNFDLDFEFASDQLDGKLWVTALYAQKDYFPKSIPGGLDLSQYEQWNHTAPDGTVLLLALSGKGHGYIIAEREDAMLVYSIDGNFSGSAYPAEDEIITREQLEWVAEAFDYAIKPEILDRDAVMEKLEEAEAARDAEQSYEPETFGSFRDVLTSRYTLPDETAQYTFFDLTGDGTEELLIDSYGYGTIDQWFAVQNGEVQFFWGNDSYLCEGMVLERYRPDPELEDYAHHYYVKADSETAWMDLDPESFGEMIEVLLLTDGQWSHAPELFSPEEKKITSEEAQAIMAQYPRIPLPWKPVMDYPVSETQTLREYLEDKDVRVSKEELQQIYREYLGKQVDQGSMHYSHYRILDINNDGVEDLLLKGENDAIIGNTDYYWLALTYRYGQITGFASDFYLCEDGVLEKVDTRHAGGFGVEKDGHQFMRCLGFEKELYELLVYNKATAGWQTDWWDEEPITKAEAEAVLAKYPRIDQGMRPIAELLG